MPTISLDQLLRIVKDWCHKKDVKEYTPLILHDKSAKKLGVILPK
jgi:hypothetical protein